MSSDRAPLLQNSASVTPYASVAQVPDDSNKIEAAYHSLRKLYESGVTKPYEWRRDALKAMRQMLVENESALVTALKADLHKASFECWVSEFNFVLQDIDEALAHLSSWMKPRVVNTNLLNCPGESAIYKDPLGLVLIISPWNYPAQLLLSPLAGALAAGNVAICKPSELSANVSAFLARLIPKYLGNYGVQVIEGAVAPTQALLKKRFDHIFYTGGSTVGKIVMRAAAEHLTPVVLELGGKSPCIVLKDSNLAVAAKRIAWAKCKNNGQTCIAPDYLLVEESVQDEFIKHLKAHILYMYGDDPSQSSDWGRIISVNHAKRLKALFDPLEPNVQCVHGDISSVNADAKYIPPLVFTGVTEDNRLMQEEIFGPLLPILPIRDVEQAISFINKREKPLALYLFTNDTRKQQQVITGTSSGGVCVNDVLMHVTNSDLPFGGVGNSGFGSYHGQKSFDIYVHEKSVLIRKGAIDAHQRYPPYTPDNVRFMQRALKFQSLSLYKPYWWALVGAVFAGITALIIVRATGKL